MTRLRSAYDEAREAAEHGHAVVPCYAPDDDECSCPKGAACENPGKHPITRRGLREASIDLRVLERWHRKHPYANWAVRCDRVSVIDIDSKLGANPDEVLGRFALADLPIVRTGIALQGTLQGIPGAHVYCAASATTKRLSVPGVEIRGRGSIALLPGSFHVSGVPYIWSNGVRPWGVSLRAVPPGLFTQHSSAVALDEWVPLDVDAILAGVGKGERDDAAFRYACSLRGRGVLKPEALALMELAWSRMDQPEQDEFPLETALDKVHRAFEHYEPHSKAAQNGNGKGRSTLQVRSSDPGKAAPTLWAWDRRVPLGYLSLLIGNEGIGKGTMVAWMIAQLTRGKLPGDLYGEPTNVVVIGDEDSFDHVWTPRLDLAGADHGRIFVIERSDHGFIELSEDQEALKAIVSEHDAQFLYIDQLLDNLGPSVDDWRTKQVRTALQPARALAADLGIAVHATMHPNKRGETFRELVSGTVAFNAVSRSSLFLAQHPHDEDRRVLVRGKGNLSEAPESWQFEIEGAEFEFSDGTKRSFPVLREVESDDDFVVTDLVGTATPSKAADAREFIIENLPNDGQWHPASEIYKKADAAGLDQRSVLRAKKRLGIQHKRASEFQAGVLWKWPLRITMRPRKESGRDA